MLLRQKRFDLRVPTQSDQLNHQTFPCFPVWRRDQLRIGAAVRHDGPTTSTQAGGAKQQKRLLLAEHGGSPKANACAKKA
mmetsp:Transcript_31133/g.88941  ORF Transcript_31133/g.88941 Transcript_31133/m.88941 type:complete len:80 (-) Transcript_31133:2-241(-)